MTKYTYDLAVIGGGAAGLTLASGAAQLGVKVLLIEADRLGGDCLHYGCVPSKSLIASARVAQTLRRAEEFGLQRVPVHTDWRRVTERIAAVQATAGEHDDPERFRKLGVEVVFARASFADSHTLQLSTGERVTAAKIAIATGSRPALPPIDGLDPERVLTNENIFTLPAQPKSLAIIGGGIIGCELGQALTRLGTRVTLLNRSERILGALDADAAAVIAERLTAEGATLITDANTTAIKHGIATTEVFYEHAGVAAKLNCDAVLIATGRKPSLAGLQLERAKVAVTRRGITVNKHLQTSQKHIYAIGDCNGLAQFTHMAGYQGGQVLQHAILHLPTNATAAQPPAVVFTSPEVATYGAQAGDAVHKFTLQKQDRALTAGETHGFIKLVTAGWRERVVGVTICAAHAGEILPMVKLAIDQKLTLTALAGQIIAYPTLAEMVKTVSGKAVAGKLFNDRVRWWLGKLFGYRGQTRAEAVQ